MVSTRRGSARAALYAADAPLSGVRSSTVPTATASAPARQDLADLLGSGHTSGRPDRRSRLGPDAPHQFRQRHLFPGPVGRGGGRMPARERRLHDQDVDAGGQRGAGLVERGDRLCGDRPDLLEGLHDPGLDDAEGEADDRDGCGQQQLDLAGPLVVVFAQRHGRGVQPVCGGHLLQRRRVGRVGLAVDRHRVGREQIHPEPRGEQPGPCDPLGQRIGGQVPRGQEAEPPGLGCCVHELRRAGPAGQRGGDHRDGRSQARQNAGGTERAGVHVVTSAHWPGLVIRRICDSPASSNASTMRSGPSLKCAHPS